MELIDLINLFSQDRFVSFVLLILFLIYGFFAVVLSIQITTYNRIMSQTGFAPIFSLIGYLNIGISVLLILITLLTI